jgi:hypothetical protein
MQDICLRVGKLYGNIRSSEHPIGGKAIAGDEYRLQLRTFNVYCCYTVRPESDFLEIGDITVNFALIMGPVSTSETSVKFYQTIRRVIFILAAVRI